VDSSARTAELNREETVTLLIACRAKINFPFDQFTPPQIASMEGNKDIEELQLKYGAKPSDRNRGASIEGRDHKGRTSLLLVAEEGSNKI